MRKFTSLTAIAAPLREENVDTDAILPAQYLLLLEKKGLGEHLFAGRRALAKNNSGAKDEATFILDQSPFDQAEILVGGDRFGIGSSREQAVWALADYGIRCIIAPSFGDIFFANCCKNGILPIRLDKHSHAHVLNFAASAHPISIDLGAQTIELKGQITIAFDIDPHRKKSLLLGLDEIGSIAAEDTTEIDRFEQQQREKSPWLYLNDAQQDFLSTAQHSSTNNTNK